jgi:hypothetical protein
MNVEPQKEHNWLNRFVGEWTYEIAAVMKPGEPPVKLTGTETVRSVGVIWIVAEGHGEMPGGGIATTILTVGYNPDLKRFVGSWIGSMMTHLWMYEGTLDPAEKVLTLNCEGPLFDGTGGTTKYKDIHTLISDDLRTLSGNILLKDGQWMEMMTSTFRRKR